VLIKAIRAHSILIRVFRGQVIRAPIVMIEATREASCTVIKTVIKFARGAIRGDARADHSSHQKIRVRR
jgi:hypothetical protein